jgi:putative nucleotidyltransferase with HDIG domain
MRVTQQPEEFLQNICNELLEVMNIAAAIAYLPADSREIAGDLIIVAGNLELNDEQIEGLVARNIVPKFTPENRAILNNNFQGSPERSLAPEVKNLIAVPLLAGDESTAVLIGLNKSSGDFDSIELKLITAIAAQASVFLSNHRLYSDLEDLLMGVLHALTATIDAKDPYTCGHSQRVALISKKLAEMMGFAARKVQQLYLAGLLHDIGKIGVPEAILCKEGRLTAEEYDVIKRHSALGAKILGGIRQLDDVIAAILNHHERPDAMGYPQNLKGDELPIEGLIVGLADSFDAMTSDRTYRKAMPLKAVVDELHRNSGTQFDPALVEKLLSLDLEAFMSEIHEPINTVFPLGLQEASKQ